MRYAPALVMAATMPFLSPLRAQDSTIVIGTSHMREAANNGFVSLLSERVFGSRCFTVSGQNNGVGTWARAVSEGANLYAGSTCRHHGLGPKSLQNGWTVRSVSTTRSCQYNDWGTWRTLTASQCTFTARTTPAVGSTSALFEADVAVRGSVGQDRRATLTWRIEIRGPRGKSPWVAQSPGQPVLVSPAPNFRLTAGSVEFSWTAPATGATDYRLCISREAFTGGCVEQSRTTGTRSGVVTVPFRGERVRWFIQACNSRGCTSSAESRVIINTLPSAVLVSPAEGATAANRRPTFSWQPVTGVQTYELYAYHPQPFQQFRLANLSSNVTQFTPATNLILESPVYWSVNACTAATGCGSPANSQQVRSLNLPPLVSFTADLAPTFKHDRCKNCHAVVATNFQRGVGGLPSTHIAVSNNTTATCATSGCHANSLLPLEGTVNPGWHAPPAAKDLRGKSDPELCAMAKDPGTVAGSVMNHLTQDKLILWAVGDGRVPTNAVTTRPLAPPGSIDAWRTRVQSWINAGMPCN